MPAAIPEQRLQHQAALRYPLHLVRVHTALRSFASGLEAEDTASERRESPASSNCPPSVKRSRAAPHQAPTSACQSPPEARARPPTDTHPRLGDSSKNKDAYKNMDVPRAKEV